MIDFPGMFDSKGAEIDVLIDLTLKWVIERAKSVKMLLVMPANCFMPNSRAIIKVVQERLSYMFTKPEECLMIGLTFIQSCANIFDEDDLMDTVQGNDDSQISFKGYKFIQIAEQDNQEKLTELTESIANQLPDCKS